VRYCCREHQVAHWKAGHKEVCQAAQAAAQQVMDAATGGLDQMHNSSFCRDGKSYTVITGDGEGRDAVHSNMAARMEGFGTRVTVLIGHVF
jgi:hypothetical protein